MNHYYWRYIPVTVQIFTFSISLILLSLFTLVIFTLFFFGDVNKKRWEVKYLQKLSKFLIFH